MTSIVAALTALLLPLVLTPQQNIIARVEKASSAYAPAVRLDPPETSPPLDHCAEAQQYREEAGLPAVFDRLVYRESRCLNTVTSRTGCCVGWLQLHWVHWTDHRMAPLIAEHCPGATWLGVRGDTAGAKHDQMCVAFQLYSLALAEGRGLSDWGK